MEGSLETLWALLGIVLLLLLNGFFVAAEFSIVLTEATRLRSQELRRRRGAWSARRVLSSVDRSLTVTQIGASGTTIIYSVMAVTLFLDQFRSIAMRWSAEWSGLLTAVVAVLVVTMVHSIVAGLIAKSLALRNPEGTLLLVAPTLLFCVRVFRPFVCGVAGLANIALRGVDSTLPTEIASSHSATDLSLLVSKGTETGVFDKDEEEMFRGVFGFSQTVAREVMTPRTDLVTIAIDASLDEVVQTVLQSGLSRFPVRGDAIDDIKGVLLVKDLLPIFAQYQQSAGDFNVSEVMRSAYFIPDTKAIDDLLNEFKRRKLHMAVVLDEHGGVDGLVTLEDLLEEIVGDIFDESDTPERVIEVEENGDVMVDGGILVSELNDRFDYGIPEGDYDTIAGFVSTSLGRIPKDQDRVVINSAGLVLIAYPGMSGIGQVGENGAQGESENDLPDEEADEKEVSVIVEKVDNQRVESVRIKTRVINQETESDESLAASEG